eukprot:EG_transcript_7492
MDPHLASLVSSLERPLTPAERFLLLNVSAQGIAKINHDQLNGVPLDATLADLRVAYCSMKTRKKALEAHPLPEAARQIVAKLQRDPSLKELEMLHEDKWFRIIERREQQGEPIQDIVEDIANVDTDEKVRQEAIWTCTNMGCRVQLQSLCPTQRPVSHSLAETTLKSAQGNLFAVGVSPVLSWFKDQPEGAEPESLQVASEGGSGSDGTHVESALPSSSVTADAVLQEQRSPLLSSSNSLPPGTVQPLDVDRAPLCPALHPLGRRGGGLERPAGQLSISSCSSVKSESSPGRRRTGNWESVMCTAAEPSASRPSLKQIRWALPMIVPSAPATPQHPPPPRKSLASSAWRWLALCC